MNAAHTNSDIPAHRVVNRVGLLTGKHHFPGKSLMQQLLENEGIIVEKDQILFFDDHFWDPVVELPPLKSICKLLFTIRLNYICSEIMSMRKLINFNKKEVEEAIKTITLPGKSENIIDSGAVKNLMIFGDEVDIDIRIQNPSYKPEKN